jgi:hypothetical protein
MSTSMKALLVSVGMAILVAVTYAQTAPTPTTAAPGSASSTH